MSDTVVSFIRTYVPVAVGSLIAWVFNTTGFVIPDDASQGLVAFLTGVTIAVYYAIARLLEGKFPWVGILLGKTSTPSYTE